MAKSINAKNLRKIRDRYNREADRFARIKQSSSGYVSQYAAYVQQQALDAARQSNMKSIKTSYTGRTNQEISQIIESELKRSESSLVSKIPASERLANIVLSSESGKSRFYAGTIDIWRNAPDRDKAIFEFFGTENLWEIMEDLTATTGVTFLAEDEFGYSQAKVDIMLEVAQRMQLG